MIGLPLDDALLEICPNIELTLSMSELLTEPDLIPFFSEFSLFPAAVIGATKGARTLLLFAFSAASFSSCYVNTAASAAFANASLCERGFFSAPALIGL